MAAERQTLLRLARRLLASPSDAEDAVQDSYVRALMTFPDGVGVHPAWMHTVVRNVAIDRLRRRRFEANCSESDFPDQDAEDFGSVIELESECRAALRHLLKRVTAEEAAAILLRDVFELEYVEIARIVGRSVDAMRQFLSRARSRTGRADESTEFEEGHLAMCWRAIEARDPAMLMEMLRTTTAETHASVAIGASAILAGNRGAARSHTMLVQVNGRYALALVLDGVVLCLVPVGAAQESVDTAG